MLPDFNRLKVFHRVYSCGSVVGAARRLNITQSGVSQHVRKLEMELDTPLFTRQHRQLVPTSAGQRLFAVIDPFIAALSECIAAIHHEREVPSGLLRIGAPMEFGRSHFPAVFAAFRSRFPEVTFHLQLGDPSLLLAMLNSGELDFALVDLFLARVMGSRTEAVFAVEPVIEEEIILACSAQYYDERIAGDHSFEHLAGLDYLAYRPKTVTLRSWFRHHFNRSPKINTVMMADSFQAVLSAIQHHMGLGITVSHFVWDEIRAGEVIPITTERPSIINRISLVQLQDKQPSLTEQTFQQHLRDHIRASGMDSLIAGHSVDTRR